MFLCHLLTLFGEMSLQIFCLYSNLPAGLSWWVILVDQMVKNLPAIQETWVQSLGWEDLLEEGMVIHFSILAWRIPLDRGA